MPHDVLVRLEVSLRALGFSVDTNVQVNPWGRIHSYTTATRNGRIVSIAYMPRAFFAYGLEWEKFRWFNSIAELFGIENGQIMILTDARDICQEALYEAQDVGRRRGVEVILLTNLYLEQFRNAATPSTTLESSLKWHLRLP